jgi:chitodextrinase
MIKTKKFVRALTGVFCLLISSNCQAATYYFSNAGNNTAGNGTQTAPFYSVCGPYPGAPCKTGTSKISMGQIPLNPGDQLLFKRGDEWVGMDAVWTINATGAPNNPITFGAYGDPNLPRPVFRGSKTAHEIGKDNWTNVPGTPIWYTSGINWWPHVAAQEEGAPMGPSLYGAWSVQGVTNTNGWTSNQSMVRGTHFYDSSTQRLYVWRTDDLKPDHNSGRDIYIGGAPNDGTDRMIKVNRGWSGGSADPKFVGGHYVFQDLHAKMSAGYGFSTSYPETKYIHCLSELNGMEGFLFDRSRFGAPLPGAKDSSMKNSVSRRNNMKQGNGTGQGITVESENVVIEDSESYENAWAGIDYLDYNAKTKTNGGKIINCKVYHNGIHPVSQHNFDPNIYIDGGSDITILNSQVWGAGVDPRGIKTRLRSNPGIAIGVEESGYNVGKRPTNIKILNTLSHSNAGQAINIDAIIGSSPISNVQIIGCTLHRNRSDQDIRGYYDPSGQDEGIRVFGFHDMSGGLVFKNNILLAYNTAHAPLFGSKSLIDQGKTGADFDNNIYYAPGVNININGTYYAGGFFSYNYIQNMSFDEWRNLGEIDSKRRDESLSKVLITSDPLLIDVTTAGFDARLRANSPAIDAADANAFPASTVPFSGTTRFDGLADDPYDDLGFHYSTASGPAPSIKDTQAPTVPSDLTATLSGTQVLLSWTASTDNVSVVGYQIFDGSSPMGNSPGNNFAFANTTLGETYSFSVKAFDGANNFSSPSNTVTLTVEVVLEDTSAPTVPLNLTGVLSGTSVFLSWQASTDDMAVTGYQILNNGSSIATGAATTFTHQASPGTICNYAVKAYDAAGNYSVSGNLLTVTIPPAKTDGGPTAPTNLIANIVGTQVQLSWSRAANNLGYNVYRNGRYLKTVGTLSTFDNSALAGNTYDYTVQSYNGSDERSDMSNMVTLTMPGAENNDTEPPTAPAHMTASISGDSILMNWDASEDNVAVNLYKIFNGSSRIGTSNSTSHSLISPISGATYNFSVQACDAAENCSVSSNVATVKTPDTGVPSGPTGLAAAVSGTQVILGWNASTDDVGVSGYQVFESGLMLGTTTSTNFEFGPITVGQTYLFSVKALDSANNVSIPSNVVVVPILDTTPPSAPVNLSKAVSGSKAVLTWNASTDNIGVKNYQVFEGTIMIATTTTTTYTTDNLLSEKHYTYSVKAVDMANNVSASSNPVTVGVAGLPIPKNLIAYSPGSSIYVAWSTSSNAIGYAVYRNNVFLKNITSASMYDPAVTAGATYTYKVQAYNASNVYSGFSNSASVTLPALSAPTGLVGVRSDNQVKLKWGSVQGAAGYNIYRNGNYLKSMGTTVTTDNVLAGQTYLYKIRAYNSSGLQSPASNEVMV